MQAVEHATVWPRQAIEKWILRKMHSISKDVRVERVRLDLLPIRGCDSMHIRAAIVTVKRKQRTVGEDVRRHVRVDIISEHRNHLRRRPFRGIVVNVGDVAHHRRHAATRWRRTGTPAVGGRGAVRASAFVIQCERRVVHEETHEFTLHRWIERAPWLVRETLEEHALLHERERTRIGRRRMDDLGRTLPQRHPDSGFDLRRDEMIRPVASAMRRAAPRRSQ